MMRSKAEIDAEIKTLIEMKPRVIHRSAFGDDHHRAIDVIVHVLTERMDQDEIDENYSESNEDADPDRAAANEALEWMEGDADDPPSDDYKSLATMTQPQYIEPPQPKAAVKAKKTAVTTKAKKKAKKK